MNMDTLYYIPSLILAIYGIYMGARGLNDQYPPLHKMHAAVLALSFGYLILEVRLALGLRVHDIDHPAWVVLAFAAIWTLARFSRELRVNAGRVKVGAEVEAASGPHVAVIANPAIALRGVPEPLRRATQGLVDHHL